MSKPFTISHLQNYDYPWEDVMAGLPMCPICLGYIPNNLTPGLYPGAISRLDNETEICSECGQKEAISNFTDQLERNLTSDE